MKFLFPLGRVLFSLIFITAAPRHFTHEGIQHAAALGVPAAGILVPLSGVLALLGGLSVATGYKARWGAWPSSHSSSRSPGGCTATGD